MPDSQSDSYFCGYISDIRPARLFKEVEMNKKSSKSKTDPMNIPKLCDMPQYKVDNTSFTMVIFGGAGDLSQRKLIPTLYQLFISQDLIKNFSIIGLGLPEMSELQYRELCQQAIKQFDPDNYHHGKCQSFLEHIYYLSGDFSKNEVYRKIEPKIKSVKPPNENKKANVIFYLAIPPQVVLPIVQRLDTFNLCQGIFQSKVIIEKPFGRDKETAKELNKELLKYYQENQIYRIDHYLGKDTVQNIFYFRLGNSIFEPLWNRQYVDYVRITIAEKIGIEKRGHFYEQTGIVRDIIQNHAMQLIALIAMEPPVNFAPDYIRDEKVKIFHSIKKMDDKEVKDYTIIGQYGPGVVDDKQVGGYQQEEDVALHSVVPTFFAGRFMLDNWRWAGVPFYILAGKRLPEKLTSIHIQFKYPPLQLLGKAADDMQSNALTLTIQPNEEIFFHMNVKEPGFSQSLNRVRMSFRYEDYFKKRNYPAYQRLIMDCIRGDLTLFARQDGFEAMWSVVDPIIRYWENYPTLDFPNYPAGSWGPAKAQLLIKQQD